MTTELMFLRRLELGEDADERAIRRAYARELKLIDQEADPAGFQYLREAYEEALFRARHTEQYQQQEAPAPQRIDVPPAASEQTPDRQAPQQEPLATDHDALAAAVFADFLQRAAAIANERPATDDAPWQRELRASLNDARLININARATFERRVAELLASGWRPGHEALLVAAVKLFGWSGDRRRVFGLGRAGAMLDTALDERATFDLQPDEQEQQQRQLIARLRDPRPPRARELVLDSATLETLIARFPTWLALITSVDHIVRWRQRNDQLPRWRRKLTFTGLRKPAEPSYEKQAKGGFNWTWLIVLAVIALLRLTAHDGGGHPSTPDGYTKYFNLGTRQLNEGDPHPAIANLSRALDLKPNDDAAIANRAAAYFNAGEDQRAAADFDTLATLNPSSPILYRGRGMLALRAGRYAEAISAFTRALALESNNGFTLVRRAEAYEKTGATDQALADIDAALRLDQPPGASPYILRMQIFAARGDNAQAVAQIEPMLAASPSSAFAYFKAAELHMRLDQRQKAMALLDRGVLAAADADLYLYRAQLRPGADKTGRESDIHSGLELAPHSVYGHRLRAEFEFENGNPDAAVATLTSIINDPEAKERLPPALLHRGVIHLKMHQPALAQADFASARDHASTATELNNVGWELARQNVALTTALSIADEALQKQPDSAGFIDSKAFILLRLGRHREAIAQYDAALKLMPALPSALYGRGIAKRRAGRVAAGDADLKAARALQPGIANEFARIGVHP